MFLRQAYYVCRSIIANCKLLRQAKYVKRNGRKSGNVRWDCGHGQTARRCDFTLSARAIWSWPLCDGRIDLLLFRQGAEVGLAPSARNVPEGFPGYLQNFVLIACIFSAYPFSAGIRRTACRRARDLARWRSTLRRCTEYTMPTAVRYPIASRRRSSTSKCRYWTKILWV